MVAIVRRRSEQPAWQHALAVLCLLRVQVLHICNDADAPSIGYSVSIVGRSSLQVANGFHGRSAKGIFSLDQSVAFAFDLHDAIGRSEMPIS
jgi:hypothetical protein